VVLVDTDVIVEFLKGSAEATRSLSEIGARNIAISAITRMELLVGAQNNRELARIEKAISAIQEIPISEPVSRGATSLIKRYAKSHGLKIPDGIIAATAIEQEIRLFTYNVRDFKFIEGLTLHST
jgi:predicted nucleic acid-binding protein